MDYLTYLLVHSDLVNECLRPRFPGETEESWIRSRIKAENELKEFEQKYPEYTQRFKIEENLP